MYDDISALYHLVYPDWNQSIQQQARAYYDVAEKLLGEAPKNVLDVSCGIGTQCLGLAELGCTITASDLSSGAVSRAKAEASKRNLTMSLKVADMRECYEVHGGGYDLVISADNSVPHLAGPAEIKKAVLGMHQCLRPGGAVLIGIRDYGKDEARKKGQVFPYGTREYEGDRYVVFQTRDWQGDRYDVGMYFVREMTNDAPAKVVSGLSRYYAITPDALAAILEEVGFKDVQRFDNATHNVLLSGVVAT